VGEDLRKIVEEAFQLPLDQLKGNLLPLLNGIKEFGVPRLMELVPDLVPKLVRRLKEVDVTKFVREDPEASARFMDILWEGISALVEKNPDVKEALERAGEVSVNLEAFDSPMKGHFRISGGKLSGGSGLLEKADLSIKGYTQAMIEVLLGERDPTEAFFKQLIKTDGSIPLAMRVSSAMMEVSELLKA
jgi:predicted lipid carrier protein YhbT